MNGKNQKHYRMSKALKKTDEKKKKKGTGRGPGRPRKNPVHEPEPREGISDTPKINGNYMEYIYDQPLITKKVWGFFKALSAKHLELIFRDSEIIYYGNGHHGKNKVRTRIDANIVNHYYVKDSLDIGVPCADMGIIMAKIDRTYTNIKFESNKHQIRKNIVVTLQNNLEIDEEHTINLIGNYDNMKDKTEEEFLSEDEYPISFVLTGKYFKKMISDIKGFGERLIIKQDSPEDPLEFAYQKRNGSVKGSNICRNKKKVKFKSKLKENESFRTEVFIEYIKPLSSAILADEITIYAHETKPLLLIAKVDAIEVRVLTDVINEQPKKD